MLPRIRARGSVRSTPWVVSHCRASGVRSPGWYAGLALRHRRARRPIPSAEIRDRNRRGAHHAATARSIVQPGHRVSAGGVGAFGSAPPPPGSAAALISASCSARSWCRNVKGRFGFGLRRAHRLYAVASATFSGLVLAVDGPPPASEALGPSLPGLRYWAECISSHGPESLVTVPTQATTGWPRLRYRAPGVAVDDDELLLPGLAHQHRRFDISLPDGVGELRDLLRLVRGLPRIGTGVVNLVQRYRRRAFPSGGAVADPVQCPVGEVRLQLGDDPVDHATLFEGVVVELVGGGDAVLAGLIRLALALLAFLHRLLRALRSDGDPGGGERREHVRVVQVGAGGSVITFGLPVGVGLRHLRFDELPGYRGLRCAFEEHHTPTGDDHRHVGFGEVVQGQAQAFPVLVQDDRAALGAVLGDLVLGGLVLGLQAQELELDLWW